MKPNQIRLRLWMEMAAVPEVRQAFGLEGAESPLWPLWTAAQATMLDPLDGSKTLVRLTGKDGREPSILLVRRDGQMTVVADDDDLGGCKRPVCDGEELMFADDDTVACANASCPNFERWF